MNTVEIIRTVVGIFFIVYGLGVSAYEQFHEMKYIDQRNGVINGFVCLIVGILVSAYNLKRGLWIGVIALAIWGIEKVILVKISKKKAEKTQE